MAQDTLERTKAAAERTARKIEKDVSAAGENLRELNITLIEMAHANVESAFDFARQAATARTPSEIVNLWNTYVPKQFQRITEQTNELAELGQKLANRSAPSITPEA